MARPQAGSSAGVSGPNATNEAVSSERKFDFPRDTLSFSNWTVWNYQGGRHVVDTRGNVEKTDRYTRRCFVMSRTAEQFFKFARFDPHGEPVDDRELARRVRAVTRRPPWHNPLPPNERIAFPGYRDLRQLSAARMRVVQNNIGLGWPTYLRLGNSRMYTIRGWKYQEKSHDLLNETLDRGQMFVAYLSDYPILHINHSVLVYARKSRSARTGTEEYWCYDPNHAEAPRTLTWLPDKHEFNFEKDPEFAGGYTRIYQVYGKFLQ